MGGRLQVEFGCVNAEILGDNKIQWHHSLGAFILGKLNSRGRTKK